MAALSSRISDILWPAPRTPGLDVWMIVDAARSEKIYPAILRTALQKSCLYAGPLRPAVEIVAPYLVRLEPGDKFTDFVIGNGWGNSWGVFLRSASGINELRRHLRGFLRVREESGRSLIFRYYDPRVLRVYLPTCWPEELRTVFGPVSHYLMEGDEPGTALDFAFDGRELTQQELRAQ